MKTNTIRGIRIEVGNSGQAIIDHERYKALCVDFNNCIKEINDSESEIDLLTDQLSEACSMLAFLVKNDSINDHSTCMEVKNLLKTIKDTSSKRS